MKIEHVALYVKDLEGARKFFEKYFCAKSGGLYHNRTSDFKSYFLTFDGGASRYNPVMLLKVMSALKNISLTEQKLKAPQINTPSSGKKP